MRPTSSSAARRSDSGRPHKSPPAPLRLEGRQKSDMPGFSHHRKGEDTKRERRESQPPLPRLPQKYSARSDHAPPSNVLGVRVPTNGHRRDASAAQQRQTSDSTGSPLGVERERLFAANEHRDLSSYADNGQSASVVQLSYERSSSNNRQIPPSRIPRSSSTTANLRGIVTTERLLGNALHPSMSEVRLPLGAHSFGHTKSSTSSSVDKSLPAVPFLEPQNVFPERTSSLSAANQDSKGQTIGFHTLGDSVGQQNLVGGSVLKSANDTMITPTEDSLPPDYDYLIDEDQAYKRLTEVHQAQCLSYWAGRFSTLSDRIRNEALHKTSTGHSDWAHSDRERQTRVLESLLKDCVTEEAQQSLDEFARARRGEWMVGVLEGFQRRVMGGGGGVQAVVMDKRKGGFMGKVFGRRKS
ncbi:MAG: hypothetical protein Q9222_000217 [Ikaeria aurantiellina]